MNYSQIKKKSILLGVFLKNTVGNFYKICYLSVVDLIKNNGIEHSGYIAFLIIFSLFPIVIFFTFILGLLGETPMGLNFAELFMNSVPNDVAQTLYPRILEIMSAPPVGVISLAFIGIVWTASSSVEGLRTILNRIHRVNKTPTYIFGRILSILHFFLITFTIITGIFSLIILPKIIQKINTIIFGNTYEISFLWNSIRVVSVFSLLFIMICLLYYLIPNKKISFKSIIPGSIITVIGWYYAAKIFTLYLKNFNQFNIIYGSLGGIIISLIFFYIISMIFIFGAEFNYFIKQKQDKKYKHVF